MHIPTLREYLKQKSARPKLVAPKHEPINPEANEYRREWLRQNGKGAAYQALRHAAKLRATPAWADLDAIARIYAKRLRKSAQTGRIYHVDHIIPLQGKLVCGLHVANNLRVILDRTNTRKSRKFVPA